MPAVVSVTPTVLPFRSTTLRIDSCANSSKQAGCTPASMTAGTPASIVRIVVAAKSWTKSTSPRASLSAPMSELCGWHVADVGEPLVAQEIVEDVNRRKASVVLQYRSRTEVVSGGASSASDRRAPVSAAAPARPAAAIGKAGLEEMTSILHVPSPSAERRRSCRFRARTEPEFETAPGPSAEFRPLNRPAKQYVLYHNSQYRPAESPAAVANSGALASRCSKAYF